MAVQPRRYDISGSLAGAELRRVAAGQPASRQRERVAILSTWHPEPVDNGRKQRTRQMIAALAEEYDILLLSLLPPGEVLAGTPPPVPGVWRQWAFPLPLFEGRSTGALLAAAHPWPRSIVATWEPAMARQIAALLRQHGVRLAIGTDLRTLRYLLALDRGVATVLDEPDVSPFSSAALRAVSGFARLRASSRRRKYRRLLRATTPRLSQTIVASLDEACAYRELAGTVPITIIENGIADTPEEPWRAPKSSRLLYPGALSYGPNAEAVGYFVDAILPLLTPSWPDLRFVVTGAIPAILPPAAAHPFVNLTGWLTPAALIETYRSARVCVFPLRSGTGTRIKILEALAYGLPVVTTTKGAEGLDVISGEHLIVADTPAEFAAATVRLLTDDDMAQQLGARGREHVRQRYSWDTRGEQLRGLVNNCLTTATPA